MYRDADEAAQRRIEQLEARVAEQVSQIEELERRLDERDDDVKARSLELDGRTRAPEKMWRRTAIALLVALAFSLIYAQTRVRAATLEEAATSPDAEPILADPAPPADALSREA